MKRSLIALALLGSLAVAGCTAQQQSSSEASGEHYTVENCGNTWDFDTVPQRVVVQDVSAVQTLAELGVLDSVVAKAGYFPDTYFDDETFQQVDAIPTLTDRLGEAGHLEITKEAVLAQEPDLIVGFSPTVRDTTVNNIPIINEPGFCGEVHDASFNDVYDHIDLYADIFQEQERGEEYKAELQSRIDALDVNAGQGRSVAVLYPAVKGSTVYAYGTDSMSNAVVSAVGLDNVFGKESERVFEISAEQLAAANPDVIVLLNSGEDDLESYVTSLPGATSITAVQDEKIIPLELAFAEPPTPFAVDGAERLEQALK